METKTKQNVKVNVKIKLRGLAGLVALECMKPEKLAGVGSRRVGKRLVLHPGTGHVKKQNATYTTQHPKTKFKGNWQQRP